MANKSLKKNYIFNVTYQIILLIAPLVTAPYISRVLLAEGVGLYSFSYSIVSYFVLVATLGTTTFGQRAISYVQNDKEARSRAFWELFIFRFILSVVTLVAYVPISLTVFHENYLIYLILGLNVLNVAVDVTWFFQGLEDFGKTVFRNIIFKILSIVAIFIFVKEQSDLPWYVFFMVIFTIVGNMSLWLSLPKYICKVKEIKPFRDVKSILKLFIPTIATQVYLVLDKSMIGWFSADMAENGYYEQAEKIAKMAMMVVTSLGAVMIPRISYMFKTGDMERVKYYLYKSYRFVWLMGVPITLGLIAVSSVFVPVFFGAGYEKCEILLPIFSSLVIFIGLSAVNGMQFFVPTGKENVLTLTVTVGAVVNLLLNLIMIPMFESLGACIATVVAEFSVTLVGFIYISKTKSFKLKPIFLGSIKYWIAGIVMFGVIFLVKYFLEINVITLIILIVIGIAVYSVMILLLRDKFVLELLFKVFGKIKRKKTVETGEIAEIISETVTSENSENVDNQ